MTGAFPLPYVIIVSDGHTIRTLHARSFGEDRPKLEAILARADLYQHLSQPPEPPRVQPLQEGNVRKGGLMGPSGVPERPDPPPPFRSTPDRTALMTQREIATTSGYTGDACQTCGEFRMKRSGTCLTCEARGSTSGGCS